MEVRETALQGVLILEPRVFPDSRGHFAEIWRRDRYARIGVPKEFAQDNVSFSRRGVLRGLHFQHPTPQGKLVTTLQGSVVDVAVDLRVGSPTFGQWVAAELRGDTMRQIWIPEGFAHGFVVTSDTALVGYKCTRPFVPGEDLAVRWDDPDLAIDWGIREPILSGKDASAPLLRELSEADLFRL